MGTLDSSGGDISAIDILNYSNAGDMETVVERLTSSGTATAGNEAAGTQTITFKASDIGMPSGGKAVLTISGVGYEYEGEARADNDGNVSFEIPRIPSGSTITVTLSVQDSDGGVLYEGSQEQTVRGDSSSIEVTLERQLLAMSAIKLTVTPPAGLTANESGVYPIVATDLTRGFTFKAEKADPAAEELPDGVTYTWTVGATEVAGGTDKQTITMTVDNLLGGSGSLPPATQTLTVKCTVSLDGYVTQEKEVTVKFAARIGSKATPDSVGDIVFSDGSASAYTESLTADQIAEAAAIIFDAGSKKGVGLNVGTNLQWAGGDWSSNDPNRGYNMMFSTSDDDGSGNWAVIQARDPAGSADSATWYPAFNWVNNYNAPGYTSGWYIPAKNELLTLYTNRTTVEAAFSALGMTSPFTGEDVVSSSQSSSDTKFVVCRTWDSAGSGARKTSNFCVPAVRVFN